MKIPVGNKKNPVSSENLAELSRLGFDLASFSHEEPYTEFVSLPALPRIRCALVPEDVDRRRYEIYNNEVLVATVIYKDAPHDNWISLTIYSSEVTRSLTLTPPAARVVREIPLSYGRVPDQELLAQLVRLGFEERAVTKLGPLYKVTVPIDSRIQFEETHPNSFKDVCELKFNGLLVAKAVHVRSFEGHSVKFMIDADRVTAALAKAAALPMAAAMSSSGKSAEIDAASDRARVVEVNKELRRHLDFLDRMVFGDLAPRGFATDIALVLLKLRALKAEHPALHAEAVSEKPSYSQALANIFPDWADLYNLQRYYMNQEVSVGEVYQRRMVSEAPGEEVGAALAAAMMAIPNMKSRRFRGSYLPEEEGRAREVLARFGIPCISPASASFDMEESGASSAAAGPKR